MKIAFVVAMDRQGLIGNENQLPWHLPADLKHFKKLTLGKSIIMGRKTFDSIGKVLPNRKNIIITKNKNYQINNAIVAHSLTEALTAVADDKEVMVIGGAQLFSEALPLAHRIYLTQIHSTFTGNIYFPAFNKLEWQEVNREDYFADENNPYDYSFIILERKNKPCAVLPIV